MLSSRRAANRCICTSTSWPSVQHGLATFARQRPRAALHDVIQMAGVEIRAKGRHGGLTGRARNNSRAARCCDRVVGGEVRVDPEGFVFFNDLAVVFNERQTADAGTVALAVSVSLGINHIDREIARGWESNVYGSGGGPSLGVLHGVWE